MGDKSKAAAEVIKAAMPAVVVLLTVGGGYFAVDRHSQAMKEKDEWLAEQKFQAEQVQRYLALPDDDVLSKRAMASYLQASFYSNGQKNLHIWATHQIDEIDQTTKERRKTLGERRADLEKAKKRRDELTAKRTAEESKLARADGPKNAATRKELRQDLAGLEVEIRAAESDVKTIRDEFEEETRQTLDFSHENKPVAAASKPGIGVCLVTHVKARTADGTKPKSPEPAKPVVTTKEQCDQACAGELEANCKATFLGALASAK